MNSNYQPFDFAGNRQYNQSMSQATAVQDSLKQIHAANKDIGLQMAKLASIQDKALKSIVTQNFFAKENRSANQAVQKVGEVVQKGFTAGFKNVVDELKKALAYNKKRDAEDDRNNKRNNWLGNFTKNLAQFSKGAVGAVAKGTTDFLKKTQATLQNNLGNLLKGLLAATMILNPEAFAEGLKKIAGAVVELAKYLGSKEFQQGLERAWHALVEIGKFSIEGIKNAIKGVNELTQAFSLFSQGKWREGWEKLKEGLWNSIKGFGALALVLNPVGTVIGGLTLLGTTVGLAVTAFKGLISVVGLVVGGLKGLVTGVGSLIAGFARLVGMIPGAPGVLAPAAAIGAAVAAPFGIAIGGKALKDLATQNYYGGGDAGLVGAQLMQELGEINASGRNARGRRTTPLTEEQKKRAEQLENLLMRLRNAAVFRDSGLEAATTYIGTGRSKKPVVDEKQRAEIMEAYNAMVEDAIASSGIQRRQHGGPINVPGYGDGDKVPMMLPPGSFVMNRNAAMMFASGGLVPTLLEPGEQVYMPGQWNKTHVMMNEMFSRFATGGIVEHLHGDPSRPGYRADHGTQSNAHDHFAFSSPELRLQVQQELARMGYQIGSTTGGRHATNSYHYSGQAFDIPWSQFGSGPITQNDFDRSRKLQEDVKSILARLGADTSTIAQNTGGGGGAMVPTGGGAGGGGGGMSNPFAGLGVFSKMFDVIAPLMSLIPNLFGGAMTALGGLFGSPASASTSGGGGGTITGGGGGTLSKEQIKQIAIRAGFPPDKANLMAAIAMAESSGRSGVVNDNPGTGDLSYGLWQINMIGDMGRNRMRQYGLSSYDDLKNPETNARVALDIYRSQGLGAWGAYTNGSYRQFLQGGGTVGGASAAPSTSSSFYRTMSRGARNAGVYDPNNTPIVVPVATGGGAGARGGVSGTSKPPQLSSSPRSMVAADYLSRMSMGMKLA